MPFMFKQGTSQWKIWQNYFIIQFSSVQSVQSFHSLSHVRLFATPWIAAPQASLSITISRSSLWLTSVESVMPSSHLILGHPLLLLPPISPSIRVFFNESTLLMRWPKYWSFSFSISPSNEQPGRISFRMDWLDLLAVQGTLKNLLQHHSSKASILRRSAFFKVQLSHPYMTTGKTIALTRRTLALAHTSQSCIQSSRTNEYLNAEAGMSVFHVRTRQKIPSTCSLLRLAQPSWLPVAELGAGHSRSRDHISHASPPQ